MCSAGDCQNYRQATRDVLRLLASLDQQLAYARDVPIADVPAELVCIWFDDLYHPESALFRASFSESEARRLAEFHAFFEARVKRIPDTLEQMHRCQAWLEVVAEARRVLDDLGWTEAEARH